MIKASPLHRAEELAELFELALEKFVAQAGAEAVPNLHDAMAYALGTNREQRAARGKRIRPVLCLLTAEALGAKIERALPFALAMELMHNFCLVHDDIEDGDAMRRGRPSVWTKFGLAHGVNVGDYLLIQSHRVLTDDKSGNLNSTTRLRLLKLLDETLDHTHVGQAYDINARHDRSITVEGYMSLARLKTGFYLAAPIQGGAIVAGADNKIIEIIARLGEILGPMFQIMDDIIDLTGDKGRESRGSDIREGKRSFMVAHAAEHCGKNERKRLFDILDKARERTTQADVRATREIFERHGSIHAGQSHCRILYERSLPILASLPKRLGQALSPVFESLVGRRK